MAMGSSIIALGARKNIQRQLVAKPDRRCVWIATRSSFVLGFVLPYRVFGIRSSRVFS